MLTKAACLSLVSLVLSGTAIADQYSFCADDAEKTSDTCSKIKVINKINVKVRSVNFIQLPTDGACSKDERNFSENLYEGEYGYVYIDPTCNYKVRFITSKGCSGDSTAYITPEKLASGKNTVSLEGKCETLKTSFNYPQTA
jgi:hypothetical protein